MIMQTICDYVGRAAATVAVVGMLAVPGIAYAKTPNECRMDYLESRIECYEKPGTRVGAGRACRQEADREYLECIGEPILGQDDDTSGKRGKRVRAMTVGEAVDDTPLAPIYGMDLVKRKRTVKTRTPFNWVVDGRNACYFGKEVYVHVSAQDFGGRNSNCHQSAEKDIFDTLREKGYHPLRLMSSMRFEIGTLFVEYRRSDNVVTIKYQNPGKRARSVLINRFEADLGDIVQRYVHEVCDNTPESLRPPEKPEEES